MAHDGHCRGAGRMRAAARRPRRWLHPHLRRDRRAARRRPPGHARGAAKSMGLLAGRFSRRIIRRRDGAAAGQRLDVFPRDQRRPGAQPAGRAADGHRPGCRDGDDDAGRGGEDRGVGGIGGVGGVGQGGWHTWPPARLSPARVSSTSRPGSARGCLHRRRRWSSPTTRASLPRWRRVASFAWPVPGWLSRPRLPLPPVYRLRAGSRRPIRLRHSA